MNYTDINQSKHLLELGLDASTADMVHPCLDIHGEGLYDKPVQKETLLHAMHTSLECKERDIPCWSIGQLLNIMPESIDNDDYWLIMEKNLYEAPSRKIEYSFSYEHYNHLNDLYNRIVNGSTPLEAAYNLIVWLLENDYLKEK